MPELSSLTPYLIGAFSGVSVLILLLSLLIGYAYSERMLWWHAGTLAGALASQYWAGANPRLSATLWLLQLALAALTLRATGGGSGPMRRPAIALRGLALGLALLAALRPSGDAHLCWLLLPWLVVTAWYLFRSSGQGRPWLWWLALGQVALGAHGLLARAMVSAPQQVDHRISVSAALALFAIATYLAMVWYSRLRTENSLRVEARERTDPLTGLATPRVFFDRVDGALIRSRNMGYSSALLLVRVENLEQVVAEQQLENSEAAILAASRAIASTLRAQDSAARLGNNRFAVMAEGIADGESNRLATRILAHGLRAEESGLRGSELQFQIAVVDIGSTTIEAREILRQLELALKHMSEHGGGHRIRTLPRITRSTGDLMSAS